jgi:hypothetical protein
MLKNAEVVLKLKNNNKKMNINKEILQITTNKPYKKQLTKEEHEEIIKNNKGIFDLNKIDNETIGNVIIHCLNYYSGDTKIDGFYANSIAQMLLSGNSEIELTEAHKTYLKRVLEKSMVRINKNSKGIEEVVGIYANWVISQILLELGETFE